jgi:hypothetical protein
VRNSDLVARIAAGVELLAVLWSLLMCFLWFISLIWVLVGLLWALLGLVVLVEGAIAVFILIKGYSPVGIAGPVIGLIASVFTFNIFGGAIEFLVLALFVGALVMRQNEDKEAAG